MFEETTDFFESAGNRRAFCGLFGKHPAWSDHMTVFGMESPTLREFKRRFYADSLRDVIDSGKWRKAEEDWLAWNHRLLIHHPSGLLLGRIVSSQDEKGRQEYPLVLLLHVASGVLPVSLEGLWACFDDFLEICQKEKTQEAVRERFAEFPRQIELAMRTLQPMPEEGPEPSVRQRFLSSSAFGEQEIGLERLLYRFSADLLDWAPGKKGGSDSPLFRVPIREDMGPEVFLCYLTLLRTQIGKRFPVTLLRSMDGNFGELSLDCLPKEMVERMRTPVINEPLLSEVAYHIPDSVAGRIRDVMGIYSAESLKDVMVIADPKAKEKGTSFFGSFVNKFTSGS